MVWSKCHNLINSTKKNCKKIIENIGNYLNKFKQCDIMNLKEKIGKVLKQNMPKPYLSLSTKYCLCIQSSLQR